MLDQGLRRTQLIGVPGVMWKASMFKVFNGRKGKKSKDLSRSRTTIKDLDPHASLSKDKMQQRIDSMLKDKKNDMRRADGKWFHFSHVLANAASNIYHCSMINAIQRVNQGVDPPVNNHTTSQKHICTRTNVLV